MFNYKEIGINLAMLLDDSYPNIEEYLVDDCTWSGAVDGFVNQYSNLFSLTRNFASNGNEEQYEEKIVQVPDKVQQAHVVQLVPVEQSLKQSERADNANHEA